MARYGRQPVNRLRKMKMSDYRRYYRALADMHAREFPPKGRR